MGRVMSFLYGAASYGLFFVTFLYAIGFVGNLAVPKSIDSPAQGPLGVALLVNTVLLTVFALQHSIMARPGFKRAWTRIIPKQLERSTFVLCASLALDLMFWQWRPLGGVIWNIEDPAVRGVLHAAFAFGWTLVLVATFLINHFDLFGLRQVWLHLRKRDYAPLRFGTPGPYRFVRHPLYLGFIIAFWAAPTMTITHLFFAIVTTAYIMVAIRLEERELVAEHGSRYAAYRQMVPMIVPFLSRKSETPEAAARA